MRFNPDVHRRRSIRLCGFDYTSTGAYFVTVVTQGRECLFGDVVGGAMRLNDAGRIVRDEWENAESLRPNVFVDSFVVMPNHFHTVVWITPRRGMARHAPTLNRFGKPVPDSLGSIMGGFKSAASRRINAIRNTPGIPVWQRNYWERVIRDESELNRVRQYIADNPRHWGTDDENPKRKRPTVQR